MVVQALSPAPEVGLFAFWDRVRAYTDLVAVGRGGAIAVRASGGWQGCLLLGVGIERPDEFAAADVGEVKGTETGVGRASEKSVTACRAKAAGTDPSM